MIVRVTLNKATTAWAGLALLVVGSVQLRSNQAGRVTRDRGSASWLFVFARRQPAQLVGGKFKPPGIADMEEVVEYISVH